MHSLTQEEIETLQKAWAIWQELQSDLVTFASMRGQAKGSWESIDATYLADVGKNHLVTNDIDAHDDGEWDSSSTTFSFEELMDLEKQHNQNKIVAETIAATRNAEQEAKNRAYRQQQYEALRKEFEA